MNKINILSVKCHCLLLKKERDKMSYQTDRLRNLEQRFDTIEKQLKIAKRKLKPKKGGSVFGEVNDESRKLFDAVKNTFEAASKSKYAEFILIVDKMNPNDISINHPPQISKNSQETAEKAQQINQKVILILFYKESTRLEAKEIPRHVDKLFLVQLDKNNELTPHGKTIVGDIKAYIRNNSVNKSTGWWPLGDSVY